MGEAAPVQPGALARRISQDLFNQRAALVSAGQGATSAVVELASLAVRASRLLAGDSSGDQRVLIDDAHDAAARLELHCSPANRLLVTRVVDEEVPDSTSLKLLIDVYFEDQVPDATIAPKLNDVRAPLIVGSDEDDGIGLDAGLEKGLRRFLRSSLAALVSRGWVGFLLGRLSGSTPTLVTQFRQRFENETLVRVLREVVAEGLRLDDIRMILDSLLAAHGAIALADYETYVLRPLTGAVVLVPPGDYTTEIGVPIYTEVARKALTRAFLTRSFVDIASIPVFTVEPRLLMEVDEIARSEDANARRTAVGWFSRTLLGGDAPRAAILCSSSSRRAVAELLRVELPDFPVITFAELPTEARVSVRSRIGLDE